MANAVILGSAFDAAQLGGTSLSPHPVRTPFGDVVLHRYQPLGEPEAYVLFRHGVPHRWLPHQIPYRAHAAALRAVGATNLLVTSSVGLLDPSLPLFEPLLVTDLLMPDNRLPDGSTCTMFATPSPEQGHLVLEAGLFSRELDAQLRAMAAELGWMPRQRDVVFAYVGGPRGKTAAENAYFRAAGAHVNSMSVGPEVVLASELEIPCAALVVGHKVSAPGVKAPPREGIAESLARSKEAVQALVTRFLSRARPAAFANHVYRFGA